MAELAMSVMEIAVFSKDGNRFIIPGMWTDGTEQTPSKASLIVDSMMYRTVLGLDNKVEWIEVPIKEDGHGEIPHVKVQMHSRALAHGGCDVLCIGGPMFDEVLGVAETEDTAP